IQLVLTTIFSFSFHYTRHRRDLHSFPTRRSSDLAALELLPDRPGRLPQPLPARQLDREQFAVLVVAVQHPVLQERLHVDRREARSEEHTSELQSRFDLVCRLLLEKKKKKQM